MLGSFQCLCRWRASAGMPICRKQATLPRLPLRKVPVADEHDDDVQPASWRSGTKIVPDAFESLRLRASDTLLGLGLSLATEDVL